VIFHWLLTVSRIPVVSGFPVNHVSAIPSSQRQGVMDCGHGLKGKAVVMDTSKVVVGTSQKGQAAVGCQPTRLGGE